MLQEWHKTFVLIADKVEVLHKSYIFKQCFLLSRVQSYVHITKTVVVLAIYKNLSQNDNCTLQKLENVLKYILGFLEYREYAKQTFLNRITSH